MVPWMATGTNSGNSGSESWLKYLNRSPSGEGTENSEAEPASRNPEARDSDPREEIGPSSVRQRVDSANAAGAGENVGPSQQAPNPPMGVPEAPDPMWLKNRIEKVFFIIKGRKPRKDMLQKLFDDLRLETASPLKLQQILRILEQMKWNSSLKGRDFRLDLELGHRVHDWEREQRHFPNPVDDVP